MVEWADPTPSAGFLARVAAPPIRPVAFVYLDWPGGAIRASSHRDVITPSGFDGHQLHGGQPWTGVGETTSIRFSGGGTEGKAERCVVGMRNLPLTQELATLEEESLAIGVDAEVWLGLFDRSWQTCEVNRRFFGRIEKPLLISAQQGRETGATLLDVSAELTDGQNPRNRVILHHAVGTETPGDTAPRLLVTVTLDPLWPGDAL